MTCGDILDLLFCAAGHSDMLNTATAGVPLVSGRPPSRPRSSKDGNNVCANGDESRIQAERKKAKAPVPPGPARSPDLTRRHTWRMTLTGKPIRPRSIRSSDREWCPHHENDRRPATPQPASSRGSPEPASGNPRAVTTSGPCIAAVPSFQPACTLSSTASPALPAGPGDPMAPRRASMPTPRAAQSFAEATQ